MDELATKRLIQEALRRFDSGNPADAATHLFNTLGYRSDKRIDLDSNAPDAFLREFNRDGRLNPDNALVGEWASVDMLFQLTGAEIENAQQGRLIFDARRQVDERIIESYLFFAVALRGAAYTRTQLAGITREINKLFPMPVLILFRHGQSLTLSVINRRLNKRDISRDVLEKVTLIKDIAWAETHRAHIEILFDLSLAELREQHGFTNFVELHDAWQKTLDSSELNKRFFREVANWYFWAMKRVTFPKDAGRNEEERNAIGVIRLITRLIFVWFVREKGLVPDALFSEARMREALVSLSPKESTYYKAILQNLFFATLNQEMGQRKFRNERQNFMAHTLYRYRDLFQRPDEALKLFETVVKPLRNALRPSAFRF